MAKLRKYEGQVYSFPDDATDQEIYSHLEKNHESPQLRDLKTALGYGEPLKNPIEAIKHVVAGLGKTGQEIGKLGMEAIGRTPGEDINYDEILGIKNPNAAGRFIEGMSAYGPFGKAASLLRSTKFIPQLAAQTAAGGAFGLTQGQPGQENGFGLLPQGKTGSALEGALINALTHGGANALEAMRPSNLLRGNLSPEELSRNSLITHGTETGLGDVIQSPYLKRMLENTLTRLPFSGANESLARTGQNVVSRGENILSNMLDIRDNTTGEPLEVDPHNIPEEITKDLINQHQLHQTEKIKLYDNFNDVAQETNSHPELKNFNEALKRNKNVIKNLNLLHGDPTGSAMFDRLIESGGLPDNEVKLLSKQEKIPTFENKLREYSLKDNISKVLDDESKLKESRLVSRSATMPKVEYIKDPLTGISRPQYSTENIKTKEGFGNKLEGTLGEGSFVEYPSKIKNVRGKEGIPFIPNSQLGQGGFVEYKIPPTYEKVITKSGITSPEKGKLNSKGLIESEKPSYTDANILKGRLNSLAKLSKSSPDASDRSMANVYADLGAALRKDVKESVTNSKNPKLINSYNQAEENYEKKYSKFLDEDIYYYLANPKANPEEIIRDFIKTSPNADLATQITKLGASLSPDKRQLLGYSYLSRALDNEGNLNPSKLGTAIEKLKPNQFKALFPDPNVRRQLKDYNKLQYMNKEAQNLMFNPHTGQRTVDTLSTLGLGLLGQFASGNLGAIATPALTITSGRLATKALTSQKLRESLIKKMIEKRPLFNQSNRVSITQTLAQALATALQGNQ
jgi:hypothetical protein